MLAAFLLLLAVAVPQNVDYDNAVMSWSWSQGTGDPATEFRIYCGTRLGAYGPTPRLRVGPDVRQILINTIPGLNVGNTYYCVARAANAAGESASSNAATFDVVQNEVNIQDLGNGLVLFKWLPNPNAARYRIYMVSGKNRTLIGESSAPYFAVAPPKGVAVRWQAVDVLANGTESRQTLYGFWTEAPR